MEDKNEGLVSLGRTLREQGFPDVANLLDSQIAQREKDKYEACIASLEETIRVGAAKGDKLKELAAKQQQELDSRAVKIRELEAERATRVWIRYDSTDEPISAYTSEAMATYYKNPNDKIEEKSLGELCLAFATEIGMHQLAKEEISRVWQENQTLLQRLSFFRYWCHQYASKGLLSRIFRWKTKTVRELDAWFNENPPIFWYQDQANERV